MAAMRMAGHGRRRSRRRASRGFTFPLLAGLVTAALILMASPASAVSSEPANPADLPDPGVWVEGDQHYVYATGNNSDLQQTNSSDLVNWSTITDPLLTLPSWAAPNWTWAPSVIKRGSTYVMYYTVRHATRNRQCVSIATSSQPTGPFSDTSSEPFICQYTLGGSIDPQPFTAPDGALYLHWKSDDNALGRRTKLWGQRLSDDGMSKLNNPVKLLGADAAWQNGIVEGPAMAYDGTTYYLFYGAGDWSSPGAGIGYATCRGPLDHCSNRSTEAAWLGNRHGLRGPSGPAVFTGVDGALRLAYHAWTDVVGYPEGRRALWIDHLTLSEGTPSWQ